MSLLESLHEERSLGKRQQISNTIVDLDPALAGKERRSGRLEDGTDKVDDHLDFHLDFVLLLAGHDIENFLEDLGVIDSRILGLHTLLFERLDDLTDVREQREVNA